MAAKENPENCVPRNTKKTRLGNRGKKPSKQKEKLKNWRAKNSSTHACACSTKRTKQTKINKQTTSTATKRVSHLSTAHLSISLPPSLHPSFPPLCILSGSFSFTGQDEHQGSLPAASRAEPHPPACGVRCRGVLRKKKKEKKEKKRSEEINMRVWNTKF